MRYSPAFLLFALVAAAPVAAQSSRPPEMADLLAWRRTSAPVLSANGQWFSYSIVNAAGDHGTVIRKLKDGLEFTFETGGTSQRPVTFSADATTALLTEWPTSDAAARLRAANMAVEPNLILASLSTGEATRFLRVRDYSYNGRASAWLAVHYLPGENSGRSAAAGPVWDEGSDLELYELRTGQRATIPHVLQFVFDSTGRRLFYATVGRGEAPAAIVARDMSSGAERRLDETAGVYRHLSLADADGGLLSAMRLTAAAGRRDTVAELLWFTALTRAVPNRRVYSPAADPAFPRGLRVATDVAISFTEDGGAVYFTVRSDAAHAQSSGAAAGTQSGGGAAGVTIWRDEDPRWREQHIREEAAHARAGYRMLYRSNEKALLSIEDSVYRDAVITPRDRWALVFERQAGTIADVAPGSRLSDVHVVDLRTGDRRMALTGVRGIDRVSPDGQRFVFYSDGHYYVYELGGGQSRNITQQIPSSFAISRGDLAPGHPMFAVGGGDATREPRPRVLAWASDSRSVLISDGWDVWNVPVTGARPAPPVNLTVNGKESAVRYDSLLFDGDGPGGLDLRRPFYLTARGEWTAGEGVARVNAARPGVNLWLWSDSSLEIDKASAADVFHYRRQTVATFPDYYVVNGFGVEGARVTMSNPQQEEFLWSAGSRLIEYTSPSGARLQATLHLPAQYVDGTRYPTIVVLGRHWRAAKHDYGNSAGSDLFNAALFTSRGYAVLFPRIHHALNDPGRSALHATNAAINAAVAAGITDSAHVGLYGQAWGGYETTFILTQSTLFSAAAAGSPVTNLVNMGGAASPTAVDGNVALRLTINSRFAGSFADSSAPFVRNSPLFHAARITTPLLLIHNQDDEFVDVNQSMDFYSALRLLGKPVVLLQYPGEKHALLRQENQADASTRLLQYFDHHLKGGVAPRWLVGGEQPPDPGPSRLH